MILKDQIAKQTEQVKKVVASHGFDFKGIDYSLHSILTLKAMMAGIATPNEWATQQMEAIQTAELAA